MAPAAQQHERSQQQSKVSNSAAATRAKSATASRGCHAAPAMVCVGGCAPVCVRGASAAAVRGRPSVCAVVRRQAAPSVRRGVICVGACVRGGAASGGAERATRSNSASEPVALVAVWAARPGRRGHHWPACAFCGVGPVRPHAHRGRRPRAPRTAQQRRRGRGACVCVRGTDVEPTGPWLRHPAATGRGPHDGGTCAARGEARPGSGLSPPRQARVIGRPTLSHFNRATQSDCASRNSLARSTGHVWQAARAGRREGAAAGRHLVSHFCSTQVECAQPSGAFECGRVPASGCKLPHSKGWGSVG